MKKRLLSLLLAFVLVLGMLPAGGLQILAHATENQDVFAHGTSICEAHIWNDGFCACGGYQSAYYNEETGVYEIGNAGQLYWFMEHVNEGGGAMRFLIGRYGSGKSFLIQLIRGYALERDFLTADCDLSPERRICGRISCFPWRPSNVISPRPWHAARTGPTVKRSTIW